MAQLTFTIALALLVTMTLGQRTEVDRGTCTYSFVIPQTDILSTCKSYSSQQVDNLQKKIEALQQKVNTLSGNGRKTNASDILNTESFSCSCDNSTSFDFAYTDCDDVKSITGGVSGIYNIDPVKGTGALLEVNHAKNSSKHKGPAQRYWVVETWGAMKVLCDLDDEDVGWTILMRRSKLDVSFDKDWYDYKWGFGDKDGDGDFWLGLEHMHRITTQMTKQYSVWMVIKDKKKVSHIFPFEEFRIDSEETNYTLIVDDYHGKYMNRLYSNRQFVTKDVEMRYNCAKKRSNSDASGGGWWFGGTSSFYFNCGYLNLNAPKPYLSSFEDIVSVVIKIKPTYH